QGETARNSAPIGVVCTLRGGTIMLDVAMLREDLAAMEKQIRFNPNDYDLIKRYLTYARKVREIEYCENGYVTARKQPLKNASFEESKTAGRRLLGSTDLLASTAT